MISQIQLPELTKLEEITSIRDPLFSVTRLGEVLSKNQKYPLLGIRIGPDDPTLPTLGLFGGVHGLERIGTQVVLSYLESLLALMSWDKDTRRRFENCRIVSIPLINPAGMDQGTRSNPHGVDLMRNAPVEATQEPGRGLISKLVAGHRIGPWLPWYRGAVGQEMEPEAKILCDFVKQEMFQSPFSIAVDFHSGFGLQDRLWYPYAKTKNLFPRADAAQKITELLNRTLPNHIYKVEPQSASYTTHGDLWDYLFDEHYSKHPERLFLPWTLEMGSWLWVKKSPSQFLKLSGFFNPMKPHRFRRIMRRHVLLIDFFLRVVKNQESLL